jgi:hypothetical protein
MVAAIQLAVSALWREVELLLFSFVLNLVRGEYGIFLLFYYNLLAKCQLFLKWPSRTIRVHF